MNSSRTVAHSYIEDVIGRGATSMQPGFEPAWTDRPWRQKRYDDVVGVTCTLAGPSTTAAAATVAALHEAIGVKGRRLRLTPNDDAPHLALPEFSLWSRGAASGGGLYPIEAYLVVGGDDDLLPGVYHYDAARHALDRLSLGDVTDEVAVAVGSAVRHPVYLVLTAKFWKNSFKYNELAYHVVTLDHGAVLEAWRVAVHSSGAQHTAPTFVFDEATVNALIGTDGVGETALSVVAIGAPEGATQVHRVPRPLPVARPEDERSRTVHAFSRVAAVQREALEWVDQEPTPVATFPSRSERESSVVLPQANGASRRTALASMRRRRSSFGRFSHDRLSLEDARRLLAVLGEQSPVADLTAGAVSLIAIAQNVEGLEPAVYDVALDARTLTRVADLPSVAAMQGAYFLENYSLGAPAMVVLIVANPADVISARGPRGLRELNATIGATVQRISLAAAEVDTGCGVVLGFDNRAFAAMAGLDDGWVPLLVAMVGPEHPDTSDYEFTLN